MDHSNETLVAQFKKSGLTQDAFCKKNNITLERLRYHLYKKNRLDKSDNHNRQSNKKHSFISFQQPAAEPFLKDPVSTYTIIHGAFTCKQLTEFIRELGGKAC